MTMSEDTTALLHAIKDSGERTERSIEGLAGEIRDLAKAVMKSATRPQSNGVTIPMMVLLLGALATPVCLIIKFMADDIQELRADLVLNVSRDQRWRERVLPLDTKQSEAVAWNRALSEILWHEVKPGQPFPTLALPPSVEP